MVKGMWSCSSKGVSRDIGSKFLANKGNELVTDVDHSKMNFKFLSVHA